MKTDIEQFQEVAVNFLRHRPFVEVLDELSIQVLELIEPLVLSQMQVLLDAGLNPETQSELLIPLVVGWILGFHEDKHEPKEARLTRVGEQLLVAATAAGWSAGNTSAVHHKQRH